MNRLRYLFTTSIGKKQLIGLSALAITGFALMHMSANLLLLYSAEAYNQYSHVLISNPLIYVAEAGLVLAFGAHAVLALQLFFRNRQARGKTPAYPTQGQKRAIFASRSMALSGSLILAFLVLHLWTFKYGPYYEVTYDGVVMRDLYRLVAEKFQSPLYVGWYVLCMILLGMHLSHGISGTFQSLGISSARDYRLRQVSIAVAVIIAGGFIIQPVCLFILGSAGGISP